MASALAVRVAGGRLLCTIRFAHREHNRESQSAGWPDGRRGRTTRAAQSSTKHGSQQPANTNTARGMGRDWQLVDRLARSIIDHLNWPFFLLPPLGLSAPFLPTSLVHVHQLGRRRRRLSSAPAAGPIGRARSPLRLSFNILVVALPDERFGSSLLLLLLLLVSRVHLGSFARHQRRHPRRRAEKVAAQTAQHSHSGR